MTWKYLTLMVLLNTFDLSTAHCEDYFNIDNWKPPFITMENLTQTIPVVRAPSLHDTIKCTLEKEKTKRKVEHFLTDCFEERQLSCGTETFGDVYFYQFMCLMSKELNITLQGCDWDIMQKILSSFGQTTTTITSTTTTTTTTTAELPPTTKTLETTGTLSSSASSSMVSSSTLPPPTSTTTAVSQTALSHSNEQGQIDKRADGTRASDVTMTTFVFILLMVIVALLMLILYKHLQHRRPAHPDMESAADVLMNCPVDVPAQSQPKSSDAEQRSSLMQDPAPGPGSVETVTEEKYLTNGQMH